MNEIALDEVFSASLRDVLRAEVQSASAWQRRWRWHWPLALFVSTALTAGGVAMATGLFSAPGAPVNTPLGNVVTATRTGTATIDIGPAPASATDLSLTLTCLSPGSFHFPNGSSADCSRADMSRSPTMRQVSEVVPLSPGVTTLTVTAQANASWTLQVVYVNQVVSAWGVNANGQTYGVPNQKGTPDLIAVVIEHGTVHGYIKASDLNCADGADVTSPAQAIAQGKTHGSISIPVYESDGTTVVGTFVVGRSAQPGVPVVPLASAGLGC